MLNMIRADFYRLRHTKTFWLTLAITVAICVLAVTMGSSGSMILVNGEPVNETAAADINGITATGFASNSMVFYCVLPLIVIVLGSEYSKGTLKNIVTTGVSRTSFFFGKFISFACVLALELGVLYLSTFITGTIIGGVGEVDRDTLANLALHFFGFLFLLLALTAVTNLFLYLTKNTAVSVILAVILPTVVMTFRFILTKVTVLKYIDMMGLMDTLAQIDIHSLSEIRESLIGGGVMLVGFLLLTNWIFNKQDL